MKLRETIMKLVFLIAACCSVLAVALICIFLFMNGVPAFFKIGPLKFLTGTVWKPGNNIFGILPMIVGSSCVTGLAILMGVPVAILTSVFLSRYCPKKFYGSCYNALREDGIMVYQHGSPFYDEDEAACRSMHRKVYRSFPVSRVYQAHIPTCPSGYWLFGFASKKYHPLNDLQAEKWNELHIPTWYYTTNLHTGAFMLPKYVEDLLEEEENNK